MLKKIKTISNFIIVYNGKEKRGVLCTKKTRAGPASEAVASSEPLSSSALAFMLNVSVKTLLKYINQLKDELMENGADILIKRGSGSVLIVYDPDKSIIMSSL